MGVDLDKWIEKLQRAEHLAEDELKALCEYVSCAAALVVVEMVLHTASERDMQRVGAAASPAAWQDVENGDGAGGDDMVG